LAGAGQALVKSHYHHHLALSGRMAEYLPQGAKDPDIVAN
jgi:hypothetical protein